MTLVEKLLEDLEKLIKYLKNIVNELEKKWSWIETNLRNKKWTQEKKSKN